MSDEYQRVTRILRTGDDPRRPKYVRWRVTVNSATLLVPTDSMTSHKRLRSTFMKLAQMPLDDIPERRWPRVINPLLAESRGRDEVVDDWPPSA